MSVIQNKTMRDVFLAALLERMRQDSSIFFLTADFGSPVLDHMRKDFPERFINVGIAEQNLINVAAGLALEGFNVYAYAIAPFITMRCYEQVKVNLALMSQLREMNVNLIGVGAGFSYVVSGPTHHSIEDISIMRTLPNIEVLSPADWVMAQDMLDFTINCRHPKYLRFDSQPAPSIYTQNMQPFHERGFNVLNVGGRLCLAATGYMTVQAMNVQKNMADEGIDLAVVDIFRLKNFNMPELAEALSGYSQVISMEEGFTGKGGLDALLLNLKNDFNLSFGFKSVGIGDSYHFELGSRDQLLENYHAGIRGTLDIVRKLV
jgi:transketolase